MFSVSLLTGYLLLNLFSTPVFAQSDTLPLDGPKSSKDLQPFITYYLDENWERTIPEVLGEYANKFKPIETDDPDFGYTQSKVWLRLDFENVSELEEDWRLYFRENFKQIFDVYVIRDNFSVENVLSQDLERGFASRAIPFPELVAPIMIEPGTEVTVLVSYWSEGASYVQLSMETASSFATLAAARTARNFMYYGMTILLVAAALVAYFVYRHSVFIAYVAYAGSLLLFLMHSDGVAYQYLWPDYPRFNSSASILTGSAIIFTACMFARVFLMTRRRHPIMDKILWSVIIVMLVLDISAFFVDNQIVKKYLVFLSLIAVLACVTAALVAARVRFREVRFYLIAWIATLAAALIMNLRHQFGVEISQDFQYNFMRFVMVFDATMMGLAIGDRYNQLRSARQQALRDSLHSAERNLQLSKRLSDLEDQFQMATEIATDRNKEFENTIHDLKQPLHALRLKVHGLMEKSSALEPSGDVEDTFAYLEKLISSHLQQEAGELAKESIARERAIESGRDLSLNEILQSVYEMFLPDAKAKGLELRYVPTSLETDLPSLVVMRMATNLVSNAIKYTDSGKVLMGCRRRSGRIVLEIHDTGRGMSAAEFAEACKRQVRLEGASEAGEGQGFGMSIIAELAAKHDVGFTKAGKDQKGLSLQLALPQS